MTEVFRTSEKLKGICEKCPYSKKYRSWNKEENCVDVVCLEQEKCDFISDMITNKLVENKKDPLSPLHADKDFMLKHFSR